MYSAMVGESPLGHRPALRCFREVLADPPCLEMAYGRKLKGSHLNTVSLIVSWSENTISVLTAGAVAQALDGTSDAD